MSDQETEFQAHCKKSREEVENWPERKRNCMGEIKKLDRKDPSAPFERRPELMDAHATNEFRWHGEFLGVRILQHRWKYDDGTCAGWRDVPVVEGD